jgi:SAM-dependent methyltransferase/predicted O-methyltransferase YrrM
MAAATSESGFPAPLDAEALALFARKGREGGPDVPQAGIANGVKVRRVLQATADLAGKPFDRLRVLDVGCGEGVYAVEAALRGARVLALDARGERMDAGAALARRHGLSNATFRREDVRGVSPAVHGRFDVVWCLGLLYHLDAPDLFDVLERLRDVCDGLLVVDTLVARAASVEVAHRGNRYEGERVREHGDDDPPEVRRARLLRSIDSTFALRLTAPALRRLLVDLGATTVVEVHAPEEPGRAPDRVTLAARFGEQVRLSSYPWVNGASREEVERVLREASGGVPAAPAAGHGGLDEFVASVMRHPGLLRMGHNQRAEDKSLGLGWLYYALARVVRPARAVVVGSYRGFVPLVVGKAFADGLEGGEVTFVDPSLVDPFWTDPAAVRAWFASFGVGNVRHALATTQEFVSSEAYRRHAPIGLLFVDGLHTAEQARFDWEAFEPLLAPRGVALFHDSLVSRPSEIYGAGRAYDIRVRAFLDDLERDPRFRCLDLPYGTGLTLVRRVGGEASEPWLEGQQARP